MKPGTQNPEPKTDLLEALVWLDYCLGETEAAMAAVQEAALEAMKIQRFTGETPMPPGQAEPYHAMCEAAAGIITLSGRARSWGKAMGSPD